VAVVAVGVTTIEVVAAEAAMVGVVTRSLQRQAAVSAVWHTSGIAYMRVREVEMMAVMWLPLSCQVEMRRKKQKNLSEYFHAGVGLAAAVGAATVRVVVVAAGSGW